MEHGFSMSFTRTRDFVADGFRLRLCGGAHNERVDTVGHKSQRNCLAARGASSDLELKPLAQARIVDLRVALPEVERQRALNVKIVELKFDGGRTLTEVAPGVRVADIQPGTGRSFSICLHKHGAPSRSWRFPRFDPCGDTYAAAARTKKQILRFARESPSHVSAVRHFGVRR